MNQRLLLALVLSAICVGACSTFALAAGGDWDNPIYMKKWQGTGRIFKEVTCPTGGDTELVSSTEAQGAMSMYFYNTAAPTSAAVTVCPRAATGGAQCNDPTHGLTIPINSGYTADVSVRDAVWSCDGTGGSTVVEVYIEKSLPPNPTPTPMATATPTPTPAPTPTP